MNSAPRCTYLSLVCRSGGLEHARQCDIDECRYMPYLKGVFALEARFRNLVWLDASGYP